MNGSGGEEEEGVSIGQWGLVRYAELEVCGSHLLVSSSSSASVQVCVSLFAFSFDARWERRVGKGFFRNNTD